MALMLAPPFAAHANPPVRSDLAAGSDAPAHRDVTTGSLPAAGNDAARSDPAGAVAMTAFLARLWAAAEAQGVSRQTFDRATEGLAADVDVAARVTAQPEHQEPMGAYIARLTSPERVAEGRRLAAEHAALLTAIETAYHVDRHVLLAIWGIESRYGTAMGSRSVVRSLASLALLDRRREAYWMGELIAALRILQAGDTRTPALEGSWAGAMGHTQFMPSTYLAYAVDFDRDGRRDLQGSVADALASTARYLASSGWSAATVWGREVILPAGFDYRLTAPGHTRTLDAWRAAGVRLAATDAASGSGRTGDPQAWRLWLPVGAHGPAFLVGGNFKAILRYNPTAAYALAVGHLADRIAGADALAGQWPADRPLARSEREELQRLLAGQGLDTGGFDGIIGDRTRAAIRATQRRLDLTEDGYPSKELLQRLRSVGGP